MNDIVAAFGPDQEDTEHYLYGMTTELAEALAQQMSTLVMYVGVQLLNAGKKGVTLQFVMVDGRGEPLFLLDQVHLANPLDTAWLDGHPFKLDL